MPTLTPTATDEPTVTPTNTSPPTATPTAIEEPEDTPTPTFVSEVIPTVVRPTATPRPVGGLPSAGTGVGGAGADATFLGLALFVLATGGLACWRLRLQG
jgi:hypothetical protein